MLDLASRRVAWWATRERQEQDLVLAALKTALLHRGALGGLHHSDCGVQYTSHAYQQLLHEADFTPSLSRKGNC